MNYQTPVSTAWATPYVGIPYVKNGNTLAGCNCWNLVALVRRAHWRDNFPFKNMEETFRVGGMNLSQFIDYVNEQVKLNDWKEIEYKEHTVGDIVLVQEGKTDLHVGLIVAKNWILHVCDGFTSTIEPVRNLRVRATYHHA